MKKILIAIGAVFLIGSISSSWIKKDKSEIIPYVLEGKSYRLLVADSPREWEQGLMYKRHLDKADGMMFIFPNTEVRMFWNKNTYMDLNLYWIAEKKVVGRSTLPSIEKSKELVTVTSPAKVDTVVEVVSNQ